MICKKKFMIHYEIVKSRRKMVWFYSNSQHIPPPLYFLHIGGPIQYVLNYDLD